MSVYNGSKYLREAIESILNQTFSDFEFIIINDGSVDDSEKIIHTFKDKRIIYINNGNNLGLIESLNKGLGAAKGKYIARMDADDVALANRFELQVKAFEADPKAIVVGSDYFSLGKNKTRHVKNKNNSDYQKAVLLFSSCFCHPTVMMKNIFKEKNILYNKNYVHAEDYQLWTELSSLGNFLNVPEPLLKYRSHDSQVSNQNNESQLAISKRIRAEYCNKLNFSLSAGQLETLNIIGNNVFIRAIEQLEAIENLLVYLKEENIKRKAFDEKAFDMFLHKFWYDSCGYTNLGLAAYSRYSRSMLSKVTKVSLDKKSRLLTKCLLRKFRSK
jgi:glycosyltransferase involved in cell wall biosynthesis